MHFTLNLPWYRTVGTGILQNLYHFEFSDSATHCDWKLSGPGSNSQV